MGTLNRSLKLRRDALGELWASRNDWRQPTPRALLQRERDAQLADLMPVVILIALLVGAVLFASLAGVLGDNYPTALASLWPLWATQAAPLAVVWLQAARRLPGLALDMARRQADGEFAAQSRLGIGAATYPGLPWLLAYAWVAAAAACLLVVLSLLLGLLAGFILATGDRALSLGIALDTLPPLTWLRTLISAWLLGAVCALAGLLVAWPGAETVQDGPTAHRLGVRAMSAGAAASLALLPVLNVVFGLIGM
jgi:ABC-type transporter Mla maintaining outer membrane lipid asymmetry permease subunit MlaE